MRTSSKCFSNLQVPKFGLQSPSLRLAPLGITWRQNFQRLRCFFGISSLFKLFASNTSEPSQERANKACILRPRIGGTEERSRESESSELSNVRHEFLGGTNTISKSALNSFRSIQYSDAKAMILGNENSEPSQQQVFVFDVETTGFCRKRERIVEMAIRDSLGGKNSCFQTLVNPEQDVPNTDIHGITTNMANHSDVPRMEEMIPFLFHFIKSRQVPGGQILLAAHNGRCFDVPFLVNEFNRCSFDIPPDWFFLDTLPLAREWAKLYGKSYAEKERNKIAYLFQRLFQMPLTEPKTCPKISVSLQALGKYYRIPLEGTDHSAMSDVNLLSSILERMTYDMKLNVTDLFLRSFKAKDLNNSKKKKKIKRKLKLA